MSRPGITYQDVANAAHELSAQGINPTIEGIRKLTGTGSNGTLAPHLRKWKESQSNIHKIASKENLPDELISTMKGLWEHLLTQSTERFAPIEENFRREASELRQELEKYKNNNHRWQKLYDQWLAEKNKLAQERITLEQALTFSQHENTTLSAKHDSLLQQIKDKLERIDELHRLHKQTQGNLEHYRESSREQRLLDQQQHENQKQQLQSEIKILTEQAVIQREKIQSLQHQHQSLQQNYLHLEKNHSDIQDELKQTKKSLAETEKVKNEALHANQHLLTQLDSLQELLQMKSNQFIELQSDNKVLSQQQNNVKCALTDSQNTNKLLNQEKWELSQEKATLEGQLKQLQKMITA